MNLIGMAARLAQPDAVGPVIHPSACTHARHLNSTCDACARACPFDALILNSGITLDATRCTACGVCLHVCPVDAISGEDHVSDLLSCASRLPDGHAVDIACGHHPDAAQTAPATNAVLHMPGCLGSLGPSAYLGVLALGIEGVTVRLDACAACPLGAVRPAIEQAVNSARSMLDPDATHRLTTLDILPPATSTRPFYSVKNPPVSRRALFRLFAAETPRLAARALLPIEEQAPTERRPPRERRRLLNALRRLPLQTHEAPCGAGFIGLAASDACTACGVCARACPTGALRFQTAEGGTFSLNYGASICTDCGICLDVCEPAALRRNPPPTLLDIASDAVVTLRAGSLRRCGKCGVNFAATTDSPLCPVCEFRRQNPFGSRLPPHWPPPQSPAGPGEAI